MSGVQNKKIANYKYTNESDILNIPGGIK